MLSVDNPLDLKAHVGQELDGVPLPTEGRDYIEDTVGVGLDVDPKVEHVGDFLGFQAMGIVLLPPGSKNMSAGDCLPL